MKRTAFAAAMLALGIAAGVVLSGRLSTSTPTSAAALEPAVQAPVAFPRSPDGALPVLSDIAERAIRASVNISSTRYVRIDPFFQLFYGADAVQPQTSLGSGVIVSADGYVLTNSHVIGNAADEIRVTLADNRELTAQVVGVDELTDLAVVKVDANGLEPLPWGDSSRLRVAEWVLAVGNPFAFSQTVTLGIVSTVSRIDPQLMTYSDFIQTDAAINPGNSGGALVNDRGELVGINTMIFSQTGGYQGIGFAIPANVARRIMDALITDGEILRGSIGNVTYRPVDSETARRLGLPQARGARIHQMYRNDPAFAAGLLPDDVILRVNDNDIAEPGQLMRLVADAPVGATLTVAAVRLTRSGPREFSVSVPVVQMRPPRRRY